MTVILHIGTPKSASSTLQSAFFAHHPDILFLGKFVDRQVGREYFRDKRITRLVRAVSDCNRDYVADTGLAEYVGELLSESDHDKVVVLSDESFCMFSGVDSMTKIERLRDALAHLGPLKVVMALREQISLLKSDYLTQHRSEMLRHPGYEKAWYPTFDQFIAIHFRYMHAAVLESFRYCGLIDGYVERFGRENVMIYPFEDFKTDPEALLARLSHFMGITVLPNLIHQAGETRENTHYSARTYTYAKWRKRLFGEQRLGDLVPESVLIGLRRWLAGGGVPEVTASMDTVDRLTAYYADDNSRLAARYGITL